MTLTFRTSLVDTSALLLKRLAVPVTYTTLKNDLESHPHFPSLLSISDTCAKYNIGAYAVEVSAEDIDELLPPFIAYYDTGKYGSDFVLIDRIEQEVIKYHHKETGMMSVTRQVFASHFKGVALILETNEKSGEPKFEHAKKLEQRKQKRKVLAATALTSLVTCAFLAGIYMYHGTSIVYLIALKMFGLLFSGLLVGYELNKQTSPVRHICTSKSYFKCDAVLHSKYSNLFGISWSEIGIFYFFLTFCLTLFPFGSTFGKLSLACLLNAVATPYVVYSIYVQAKLIKDWCLMCLLIQVVLLGEFLWFYREVWQPKLAAEIFTSIPAGELLSVASASLILYLCSKQLKAHFREAKVLKEEHLSLVRLRNHPGVFITLLKDQKSVLPGWENCSITLGSENPQYTLINVCSLFCNPCSKAHFKLDKLLNSRSDVQLRIIFKHEIDNDQANQLSKELIDIYLNMGEEAFRKALDTWHLHRQKDSGIFSHIHGLKKSSGNSDDLLKKMSKWCESSGIEYTPTFYLQGYKVPEPYTVDGMLELINKIAADTHSISDNDFSLAI